MDQILAIAGFSNGSQRCIGHDDASTGRHRPTATLDGRFWLCRDFARARGATSLTTKVRRRRTTRAKLAYLFAGL
jgi:hypothetical protein